MERTIITLSSVISCPVMGIPKVGVLLEKSILRKKNIIGLMVIRGFLIVPAFLRCSRLSFSLLCFETTQGVHGFFLYAANYF